MAPDLRDQLQATLGSSYTLERELTGAGMSRVFVATETRLNREVVVKLLSPEMAAGVSAERFEREIRVAASLQQANIVPVLSAGESHGLPYYTMPFVEGESLRMRLTAGGMRSITEVVRVLGDVARALAYAHARGVVHRDIKPDNILLSGGTAVVTDFGIAKAISASRTESGHTELTQFGTMLGTPAYMAPEQAAGDPDVDHRADIYAFGCLAYELLTGRTPFIGHPPHRMLAAHMGEQPHAVSDLRPDTPPALADLVMQCLAKEPAARPQEAGDLMRMLDSVPSAIGLAVTPSIRFRGGAMMWRALGLYVAAFVVVVAVVRAAIVTIGLPGWVLPGAIVVMLLGLPAILLTGYVHLATYRALTGTLARTPGGTLRPSGRLATLAVTASPHVSWRRTTLGGVVSLGLFVLFVSVFMVMRAAGIGPAATLLSTGRLSERDRLILTDFRISNTDSALGRVASDAVRQGLSESRAIRLMSAPAVQAALVRMERSDAPSIDLALAREIAQREGAKAIIDGEVTGVGTGYIVTLRLVTSDSGSTLTAATASGEGPHGLVDALDKVTRALRARVGESLRAVQNAPALALVTTGSLESLQKYSEAVRTLAPDPVKTIQLLREAIALDSTFAMAWSLLAQAIANAGGSPVRIDSARTKAYEFRHRLTERERLMITATYFGPRDRERAIAALEDLMATGDTAIAGALLGSWYTSRRQFERADSMYALSIRADSSFPFPYDNRWRSLVTAGRLQDAERAVDVLRSRFGSPRQVRFLLYHQGRIDELRAAADSMASSPEFANRGWGLARQEELARRDGRPAEAERLAARFRARVPSPSPGAHVSDSLSASELDLLLRANPTRAVERIDNLLARFPFRTFGEADRRYFDVAELYARAGRPDKAKGVLAGYAAEVTDTSLRRVELPRYNTALAEVALAERRYRDAIDGFRRGDSLPDGPVDECTICLNARLARAFDAAHEPDSAISHYERYINTPYFARYNLRFDPTLLALTHFRLGELYEGRDDGARALEHYRQFVDLWKNAEPELMPQVREARRRIARLTPAEQRQR